MDDLSVLILGIPVATGAVTAIIAQSKGLGSFPWFVFGALLFIIALPAVLIVKPNAAEMERRALIAGEGRKCPACAEMVKAEARVCRFCGFSFV